MTTLLPPVITPLPVSPPMEKKPNSIVIGIGIAVMSVLVLMFIVMVVYWFLIPFVKRIQEKNTEKSVHTNDTLKTPVVVAETKPTSS